MASSRSPSNEEFPFFPIKATHSQKGYKQINLFRIRRLYHHVGVADMMFDKTAAENNYAGTLGVHCLLVDESHIYCRKKNIEIENVDLSENLDAKVRTGNDVE